MSNPVMRTFAERLKLARLRRDLSQADLAKLAGVAAGTIGNLESGTRRAPRQLLQLAAALGVRPEWLQLGTGPMLATSPDQQTSPPEGGAPKDSASYRLPGGFTRIIAPTLLSWKMLMSPERLPDTFTLQLPDDAMAPEFPCGSVVLLSTVEGPPRARDAVLCKDANGNCFFREFRVRTPTLWQAAPIAEGYATLASDKDGLTVLAVCVGRWGRRG
jgi:transcriptional regulator with XRE-family HTH domain